MIDLTSRLAKIQLATLLTTAVAEFFCFIATITPAWQVAEDTDVGRSIQSGLWIYCPGTGAQCWYIFSDDLINYYERVDVCRFLLIGDCRKKLLRTPYFFGWHYAVLIMMLIVLLLGGVSMISLAIGSFRVHLRRITTIVLDITLSMAFLLICIALAVFMINAEMLESKYLIGVKNTFEKSYGYSFFLACLGLTIMLFAIMLAIFMTTSVFFSKHNTDLIGRGMALDRTASYVIDSNNDHKIQYRMMQETPPMIEQFTEVNIPRYAYSPSETSSTFPTRTFMSYQ